MPKYYPLMIDLEGKAALVVGGGPVGTRKAALLAEYGARVTIVAKQASAEARCLAADGGVRLLERPFAMPDLDDAFIVFAATGDRALHEQIKAECDHRRIPCNIVDVPDLCSFIVPSIIRRGELMVTISTDGLCPSYSKYQRRRMMQCCFPEGCESLLHVASAARGELKGPLGKGMDDEEKFAAMEALMNEGLEAVVAESGESAASEWAIRRVREIALERKATTHSPKETTE